MVMFPVALTLYKKGILKKQANGHKQIPPISY